MGYYEAEFLAILLAKYILNVGKKVKLNQNEKPNQKTTSIYLL
jgi:hypothetical protein